MHRPYKTVFQATGATVNFFAQNQTSRLNNWRLGLYSRQVNQEFREVVWLLMLIPFGIVSGTGIFFIFCAWRRSGQPIKENETHFPPLASSNGFSPSIFEQPATWLAVKTNDPSTVQAALHLDH